VFHRIELCKQQGIDVYIYDNTVYETTDYSVSSSIKEWHYWSDGINHGIGAALRFLCARARQDGHLYLLNWDQDTIFDERTLKYVADALTQLDKDFKCRDGQPLLSITFRDMNPSLAKKPKRRMCVPSIYQTALTISSGSLFHLERLEESGGHRASFFVDLVDYDVCLAASRSGYVVAEVVNVPGIDHMAEQADSFWSFYGFVFSGRRYPLWRVSGYFRNSFRLLYAASRTDGRIFSEVLIQLVKFITIQLLARMSFKHRGYVSIVSRKI